MTTHNHVTDLLSAYVHGHLSAQHRQRVTLHLRTCAACRAALERENAVLHDLTAYMPALGKPTPGQLRRLWPAIWSEVRTVPRQPLRMVPSAGVLLAMLLICAFSMSALVGGTTHAMAAPNPFVPSDMRATNTPIRTDSPEHIVGDESAPLPSQTASPLPMASPAPLAVRWNGPDNR